jgi:hypothetical protein
LVRAGESPARDHADAPSAIDEPSAVDEPSAPDEAEDEPDADPLFALAWMVVEVDPDARSELPAESRAPGVVAADLPAGTDRVLRPVPSASAMVFESGAILASAVTFESAVSALPEFVSESVSAAFDFRTVLSS